MEQQNKTAYDLFLVTFNDDSTAIKSRFEIVANFGNIGLFEDGKNLVYNGQEMSFVATPKEATQNE